MQSTQQDLGSSWLSEHLQLNVEEPGAAERGDNGIAHTQKLVECLYREHLHFLALSVISDFSICQPPPCPHPFIASLLAPLVLGSFALRTPNGLSQQETGGWEQRRKSGVLFPYLVVASSQFDGSPSWRQLLSGDPSMKTALKRVQNMFPPLVALGLGVVMASTATGPGGLPPPVLVPSALPTSFTVPQADTWTVRAHSCWAPG